MSTDNTELQIMHDKEPDSKDQTWLTCRGDLLGIDGLKKVIDSKIKPKIDTMAALDLGFNNLTGNAVKELARSVLIQCSALKKLHVGNNPIGDEGVVALCVALAKNPSKTLQTLDLSYVECGDKGARALAALIRRKPIAELYLAANAIGDEGAIALANALATNKTLEILHLPYNNIGDVGGRALYNALPTNTKLKKFWIMNNVFNAKIGEAIHKKIGERGEEPYEVNPQEAKDEEETVKPDTSKELDLDSQKIEDDPNEKPCTDELADDDRRECAFMRTLFNKYYEARLEDPTTSIHHVSTLMYVNQIGDIDSVNQIVYVDFDVAYYWIDDDNIGNLFSHYDVEKIWKHDIEVMNAFELEATVPDGTNYWINLNWSPFGVMTNYQRYKGTVKLNLDLHMFPFDCQEIIVQMKSTGSGEGDFSLLNATQQANMEKMTKGIEMIEWNVMNNIEIKEDRYWNNHEERYYSELDFVVSVQRKPGYYLTKICTLIFFLVVMSFVVYFMPQDDLGSRVGVLFTLFLAAVAFQFVVGSTIPRTSYSTLLDQFITLSYIFLVAPCIESVVVSEMAAAGTDYYVNTAKKVDVGVLIASAITWVVSCGVFAFVAQRKVIKRKKGMQVVTSEESINLTKKDD